MTYEYTVTLSNSCWMKSGLSMVRWLDENAKDGYKIEFKKNKKNGKIVYNKPVNVLFKNYSDRTLFVLTNCDKIV